MTQATKDYAFLHFIVLIWGFTAILGMVISLPAVEVVFFRTMLAAVGLAGILVFRKKGFRLPRRSDFLIVFGTGVLIAIHWVLFFFSARISTISICLAGLATCSLWTSLIEPLVSNRKIKLFEVVLSGIAFVGIVVIFNVEFNHLIGFTVAVISALMAAIFAIINSKLTQRIDPFVITFYEIAAACVSIGLFLPIYKATNDSGTLALIPTAMDWFYLLILSSVCTVFAFSYSIWLMQRLSAFTVNLSVNMEPVYGIILALLIFPEKEKMAPGFYLGTSLILLSVLIYPILNRASQRKALDTDFLR